jgi:hypothetical protein
MNIGHGVERGIQRPAILTFPCEVLYFSSANRYHLVVVLKALTGQDHRSAGLDVACLTVPFCPDAEDFFRHTVLDGLFARGLIQNLDRSGPDRTRQHVPGF